MKIAFAFVTAAIAATPAFAAAVIPAASVPTLDEIGLVGLVALIGAVGGLLARRRRK